MNSRGFTFIELLVVMVLVAVSGSLVYMSVGRSAEQKQGKIFAQEMLSLVKKARRTSVASSRPVAFLISSQDRFCWVEGQSGSLSIPERVMIQEQGIAQVDGDAFGIYFYPDGSSSGGEITLAADGVPFFIFRVDILTGLVTRG
jgi:general secretion pathway protein H